MPKRKGIPPATFEEASRRVSPGRSCPACGFGKGKGFERRPASRDNYCHNCRIEWSWEMEISDFLAKLASLGIVLDDVVQDGDVVPFEDKEFPGMSIEQFQRIDLLFEEGDLRIKPFPIRVFIRLWRMLVRH